MEGNDCLVNTDSFISALNYLKKKCHLDYRVSFLSSKLSQSHTVTIAVVTQYLKDLDFSVRECSLEEMSCLKLESTQLLLCFDHEHDIIILGSDSDPKESKGVYSEAYPILLISHAGLHQQQCEGMPQKDIFWFFRELTGKDGVYLLVTGLITNLLMYVVPIYNMNVFDKVLPHGFMGILSSLVLIAVFLVIIWFINRSALSYLLNDRLFQMDIALADNFTRRLCSLKPSAMPHSASFMTQLITYGKSLSQMIGLLHLTAMIDLPFMIISLVLIGWFGGTIVVIPLVAMALVIALNLVLQPKIRNYIQKRYEFDGRKRKFEYEIMQSLPFIKMAGMERYFTDYVQHNRPDHRQYFSISSHINHISTLILFLSLIAVTALGAYRVSESIMTMGQLVACSLLAAKAISNASITSLLFNVKSH